MASARSIRKLRRRAQLAYSLSQAALTVAGRRLRGQPLHPSWPARYELAVTWLKSRFHGSELPIEKVRRAADGAGALELRRARVDWEELRIDTPGGPMRAEWARERGGGPTKGALLYLHGGAYMFGSVHSHRSMIAGITLGSGVPTLAIEYRLAPEHPCPAAIEDAVAAYRWLLEVEGLAPSSVAIAGDSAGGGLTLTTLLTLRDQGLPLPAGAICISPWTDLTLSGSTIEQNAPTDYLPPSEMPKAVDRYRGELPADDPRVSPLFADLGGLPPLLIQVGDAEVLYADGVRLAEKARAAGVEVSLDIGAGQVHVWHLFGDLHPESAAAIRRVGAFAKVVIRRATTRRATAAAQRT